MKSVISPQSGFGDLKKTSFLDALRHAIFEKKRVNKNFNLSLLSRKSGLSSSLISLILKGKRLVTLRSAEKLALALGLRGRNRTYFLKLAKLHSARSEEERFSIENEILKLKAKDKASENLLQLNQYRLLSSWYYPVIYSLVGTKKLQNDPQKISGLLKYPVRVEEVEKAIADLIDMKLLTEANGVLAQTTQTLATDDEVQRHALIRYHKSMLQLADKALLEESAKREFRGLTIGIPKKQIPVIKQKIRDFFSELNIYLSEFHESEEIHQINLQMFSLSLTQDSSRNEDSK